MFAGTGDSRRRRNAGVGLRSATHRLEI